MAFIFTKGDLAVSNSNTAVTFSMENEKNANLLTLKAVWIFYAIGVTALTLLDLAGMGSTPPGLLYTVFIVVLIPHSICTFLYYRYQEPWVKYPLLVSATFNVLVTAMATGRGEFLSALWLFPVLLCILYNNQRLMIIFLMLVNLLNLAVITELLVLGETLGVELQEAVGSPISLLAVSAAAIVVNRRGINFLSHVMEAEEKARSSGERLSSILSESKQTASVVQDSGQKLASSANSLSSSIDDIASTANELSTNLQDVSNQVQQISSDSDNVSEGARVGQDNLEKLKNSTSQINQVMEQIQQSMEALLNQSDQIGRIALQIKGIADQTNLLALNAAIEAARAGHSGRGFAVVAEEVKKLSEQTSDLADQITSVVKEGNQLSTEARDSIESGSAAIGSNTEVINDVSTTLKEVLSRAGNIASNTQHIAQNLKELTGGGESLAATTEEQTAATEELSTLAQKLLENANNLEQELLRE